MRETLANLCEITQKQGIEKFFNRKGIAPEENAIKQFENMGYKILEIGHLNWSEYVIYSGNFTDIQKDFVDTFSIPEGHELTFIKELNEW
jgi:hypothetical protein